MNNLISSNLSKSQHINNPKILSDLLLNNYAQHKTKQQILNELNKVDEQIYQIYESSNPIKNNISNCHGQLSMNTGISIMPEGHTSMLASTFQNTNSVSLGIPKNNSLTDSFLRSTLGCEEKLAKSYLQIIDQTDLTQQSQREKRIQEAKKRFAQANNYKDTYANCKPFMDKSITKGYLKKTSPVIDNEHDSYLKTQLIFLQKPISGNKKLTEKQYYDKHAESVAKKINEIGGMEDTVGKMEDSLNRNQIRNFSKRSHFGSNGQNPYKKESKSLHKKNSKDSGASWVDRSRAIRQALFTKFDIR